MPRPPRPPRLLRRPARALAGAAARVRPLVAMVALLAAVGLAAGWTLLRDASLFAVEKVSVTGVSSSQGAQVRSALETAAKDMTTLHVRRDDLLASVEGFTSVAGLRTRTDFPHGLEIEVTEREPVAEVDVAGRRVPVGAGGRLMEGVRPARDLPLLRADRLAPGGRLTDAKALAAIATLAAAPDVLRKRVSRVSSGPKGLTLDVREGPQLYFGANDRLEAKWLATARVLAEPSAAGAVYLDVRVPDRVAAGGLGSGAEAGAAGDPPTAAANAQPQAANPQLQAEEAPTLNP